MGAVSDLFQEVMYRAVAHKFTAHPDLMQLLLATGNAYIIEHRYMALFSPVST